MRYYKPSSYDSECSISRNLLLKYSIVLKRRSRAVSQAPAMAQGPLMLSPETHTWTHSTANLQVIRSHDPPGFLLQNWGCKHWTGWHVWKGVPSTNFWINLPFAFWVNKPPFICQVTTWVGYFCIHVEAEGFLSMSCQSGPRKRLQSAFLLLKTLLLWYYY